MIYFSEKNGSLATPSPENVEMMMNKLSDLNGQIIFWTPLKRWTRNQWMDDTDTYTISDIIGLVETMENVLFRTNQSVTLSRE